MAGARCPRRCSVTCPPRGGERVTIRLSGEHDLSTAPEVNERIDAALQEGANGVYVNLDAVTFLDASLLGALVRGRNHCAAHETQFVVTCSNQRTRHVFAIARLADLLHDEP
jgi:anti-anti-sigma factor